MMRSAYVVRSDCDLGPYWVCRTCRRCYLTEPQDLTRSCYLCHHEPRRMTVVEALVAIALGLLAAVALGALLSTCARRALAQEPPPAAGAPLTEAMR